MNNMHPPKNKARLTFQNDTPARRRAGPRLRSSRGKVCPEA